MITNDQYRSQTVCLYNRKVQSAGTFQIYVRKYLRNTSIIDRERDMQLSQKLFRRESRARVYHRDRWKSAASTCLHISAILIYLC